MCIKRIHSHANQRPINLLIQQTKYCDLFLATNNGCTQNLMCRKNNVAFHVECDRRFGSNIFEHLFSLLHFVRSLSRSPLFNLTLTFLQLHTRTSIQYVFSITRAVTPCDTECNAISPWNGKWIKKRKKRTAWKRKSIYLCVLSLPISELQKVNCYSLFSFIDSLLLNKDINREREKKCVDYFFTPLVRSIVCFCDWM